MNIPLRVYILRALSFLMIQALSGCAKFEEDKSHKEQGESQVNEAHSIESGGKPVKLSPPFVQVKSYSYWKILNGCSTETQTFESKKDLCKGLQDRNLNHDCALELRKKEFIEQSCPGEFSEFIDPTTKLEGPPSIRCQGFVDGQSGRKEIDQTIRWNRKKAQKIVLSGFKELKNSGEFSVFLIPKKDFNRPGEIRIFGWFIDNNKNQSVSGSLGSQVTLKHSDSHLNGREVEIRCGLAAKDDSIETYKPLSREEMFCSGSFSKNGSDRRFFGKKFIWDGRTHVKTQLKATGGSLPSDLVFQVSMEPGVDGQSHRLKLTNKDVDGHVSMVSEVEGGLELNLDYISAWDRRRVQFFCGPDRILQENLKNDFKSKQKEASDEPK